MSRAACKLKLRGLIPQIKPEDVDMFLKGGAALDISSARKKPKVADMSIQALLPACLLNAATKGHVSS